MSGVRCAASGTRCAVFSVRYAVVGMRCGVCGMSYLFMQFLLPDAGSRKPVAYCILSNNK